VQAALSRLRYNWAEAVAHLRGRCPSMAAFIGRFGGGRLRLRAESDLFRALARAIVYQQLSGKAAETIHGRFAALFPGGSPDAERTLMLPFERLREAGLSNAKARSVQDLADKVSNGALPAARRLGRMSDEAIVACLSQVRGIGPWTAQMHLIFNLGRPDVMPATDLGVQKGVRHVYGLEDLPDPGLVLELTGHLAPFRSAASWYFWRAADA